MVSLTHKSCDTGNLDREIEKLKFFICIKMANVLELIGRKKHAEVAKIYLQFLWGKGYQQMKGGNYCKIMKLITCIQQKKKLEVV